MKPSRFGIEYFLEHGVPDEFYTEDYDCVANSDQIIEMYLPRRQALEEACRIGVISTSQSKLNYSNGEYHA